MRHTKIIATIGPASDMPEVLDALLACIDVARLNASHATPEELDVRFRAIRASAARVGRDVAVMLDLPGPKLRVGGMVDGTVLKAGARFDLDLAPCVGDVTHACVSHPRLAEDVRAGDAILLDDGRIQLRVSEVASGRVITTVETGGPLGSNKGVNVPGVTLGVESISDVDRAALAWGLAAGVDMVAQSFVRSAEDIVKMREIMGDSNLPLVVKVEKHEAVERLDEIVAAADVVMVARGDLGVETSPESVPVVQRRLIAACRLAGKPVIVATQMLESMVTSPRPTRAEASDVATAIFQGADAVMLSGETAIGQHPVEATAVMERIAVTAEASMDFHFVETDDRRSIGVTEAVSAAACELAYDLGAGAIVSATQSGATARAVARNRPGAPIVAVTSSDAVARQLRVVWGVVPEVVRPSETIEDMMDSAMRAALASRVVCSGDLVVITAGVGLNRPGTTDLIQVHALP
jgi:pyruvate kinase